MSLSIDGVWKSGVWATTVWVDGFWREGSSVAVTTGTGGGSWKSYRYLPVQEQYKKRKEYDEEELKRLILKAEERNKEEIELLTRKSAQLYNEGLTLSQVREEVNKTKRELEDRIRADLLFDVDVQLKFIEFQRMRKMAMLLLMSAA